jgi:hypothetical protein
MTMIDKQSREERRREQREGVKARLCVPEGRRPERGAEPTSRHNAGLRIRDGCRLTLPFL